MDIIYSDKDILVCIKPSGVLSTDEPGGLPSLLREELGDPQANIRTVHRLDRVVSGLMVVARRSQAASALSDQIRRGDFQKEYLAVCHGILVPSNGEFTDLLLRDKLERKTYVVSQPGINVQKAILDYTVLSVSQEMSRVKILLKTGRTHQIRAQFSNRGYPLVGDRKYGLCEDECNIALWSHKLIFIHPYSGKKMEFTADPPAVYPWTSV